ncbi:unnamed protein product [Paramecium sonneborni]|uniref:Tetratricopeptide repeat protein n=1 Tax=Paramecium sonneborni TaxID=65129 RepID=A0A8S1QTQ2_9CILI|nr:unnamed protein product [Paramecium sonneborni]
MIQQNQKDLKINFSCKEHDQKQVIMWCSQPDCKEERLCCSLCNQESKHITHLQNVLEIELLGPFFTDQKKMAFELKLLTENSSKEFCNLINEMINGIEQKFYWSDPDNIASQELICDAIQFSFQFQHLYQNIKEHCVKKSKEIQEYLGQFDEENELNIWNDANYCKLGDNLLKLNRLDEAKIFYEKSLYIKKTNFNAKFGLAQCLQKQHNYKEALELYKEAQNNDKNNNFIKLQIAECLRKLWQNEEALAAYSQAFEIEATTYGFFIQIVTLIILERNGEAYQLYKKAKQLEVKDSWMNLCKILINQMDDKKDKAKKLINETENDSDEQVDFWISFVKMLYSIENKEETLKYANQILKNEPNNLIALEKKFGILRDQNQYEEVILLFDQMQKIIKKHKLIRESKKKLYSQLQNLDYQEQMDIYELILQFNPKNITALILKCKAHFNFKLGQCLINKNKLKLALYTLEKILKLNQNQEILELKLELLQQFSSEFDKNQIHDFYTKWLKNDPSNIIVLELLYVHLIKQKDYREADKIMQQISQFEPNYFQQQFNACKYLIQLGKSKDAITLLNQMIETHAPTEKILDKEKKLFYKIIYQELYGSRRKIAKLLQLDPNNFIAQIVECVLILKENEDKFEQRVWLFKYIDDNFDQNHQDKLKLILNFIDNEQEKSIRERVFIMKAIKGLFLITKNKEQNQLIKFIKKSFLKMIQSKLGNVEQLSFYTYILTVQPDNVIALEFKTRYLIEKNQQFQQSQQDNKKEILENLEIILNKNPLIYSLVSIKCEYLLKENNFREAIETVNSILTNKNYQQRFKNQNLKNPLSDLINKINVYFRKFDQKSKFTELNKILQANQDNLIALELMCITLLEEKQEVEPNVSDSLQTIIKFLNRLNPLKHYLSEDIRDIKYLIEEKFENNDDKISIFTRLELNDSEKIQAYLILCELLKQDDQWQEIQKIINQMLIIDPKNFSVQNLQTKYLFKQGKFLESYIALDQTINDFQNQDSINQIENLCCLMDYIRDGREKDEQLQQHVKVIQNRDPQSIVAILLSNQDNDTKEEIFQNILKNNPNKQFYQWLNIRDLMAQEKYKELMQLKMLSNVFLVKLIENLNNIMQNIKDDIDNKNIIQYFDELNLNGPSNRLFEIVKSFLIFKQGNYQESIEQLQKLLAFDELNWIKNYDFSFRNIFRWFSNRFFELETKGQIEAMINQILENDSENLVLWFLNICIKLDHQFY